MIIPIDRLDADVLNALIEEFITREGTDYGDQEVELSDKVKQLHRQLVAGETVIVFDAATESTTLMTQQQYMEYSGG